MKISYFNFKNLNTNKNNFASRKKLGLQSQQHFANLMNTCCENPRLALEEEYAKLRFSCNQLNEIKQKFSLNDIDYISLYTAAVIAQDKEKFNLKIREILEKQLPKIVFEEENIHALSVAIEESFRSDFDVAKTNEYVAQQLQKRAELLTMSLIKISLTLR
jgi:hypothetical protein